MFSNLIASAMSKDFASRVHPAFAELIRQMTPDEAKLLAAFGEDLRVPVVRVHSSFDGHSFQWEIGYLSALRFRTHCAFPDREPTYLDNLRRLGLITIAVGPKDELVGDAYAPILRSPPLQEAQRRFAATATKLLIVRGHVELTPLGLDFLHVCVKSFTNEVDVNT
jgi:hypothetical protein